MYLLDIKIQFNNKVDANFESMSPINPIKLVVATADGFLMSNNKQICMKCFLVFY